MRVRIAVWLILMMFVGLAAHAQTLLGFPPGLFGKRASDVASTGCAVTCPGDLTFSGGAASFANWYSIYRCYQATYTGNVADIYAPADASHTLVTCSAGGIVNETLQALSTTCMVSCTLKTLYNQANPGTQDLGPGTRPTVTTGCVGGKPCAVCTKASSQYLVSSGSVTINQPISYYGIINLASRGSVAYLLTKTGVGLGASEALNRAFVTAGGGANAVTAAVSTAAWHGISGTVWPTQNGVAMLDGTDGSTITNVGTNNSSGTISLCASNSGTLFMDGNFVEGGLNNNSTQWNNADRALVYTNPKSYWGF